MASLQIASYGMNVASQSYRFSALLQRVNPPGRELRGRGGSAHIACQRFAFAIDAMQGAFYAPRRIHFADVVEHHDATHQQRGGIRDTFARNVRPRAVTRLKDRAPLPDFPARPPAEPADKPRCQV